jgi:hypothetical protein
MYSCHIQKLEVFHQVEIAAKAPDQTHGFILTQTSPHFLNFQYSSNCLKLVATK